MTDNGRFQRLIVLKPMAVISVGRHSSPQFAASDE
jgi:hypothetical protein